MASAVASSQIPSPSTKTPPITSTDRRTSQHVPRQETSSRRASLSDPQHLHLVELEEQVRTLTAKLAASEGEKAILAVRAEAVHRVNEFMRQRLAGSPSITSTLKATTASQRSSVSAPTTTPGTRVGSGALPTNETVEQEIARRQSQSQDQDQIRTLQARIKALETEKIASEERATRVHRLNEALRARMAAQAVGGSGSEERASILAPELKWEEAVVKMRTFLSQADDIRRLLDEAEMSYHLSSIGSTSTSKPPTTTKPPTGPGISRQLTDLLRHLDQNNNDFTADIFGSINTISEPLGSEVGYIVSSPPQMRRIRTRAQSWSGPTVDTDIWSHRDSCVFTSSCGLAAISSDGGQEENKEMKKLEALWSVPMFAGFEDEVLKKVAKAAREETRVQGEVVAGPEEMIDAMFIVLGGKVTLQTPENSDLATFSESNIFGDLAVGYDKKARRPPSAQLIAKTDCELVVLTRDGLHLALKSHPEQQEQIKEMIGAKQAWLDEQERKGGETVKEFGGEFLADIARKDLGKLMMLTEADGAFIEKLLLTLTPEVYEPSTLIVQIGDPSTAMFFIHRGTVEVVGPTNQVHAEMVTGSFFGEVGLLYNMPRTASIRAKERSLLMKMTSEGLERVSVLYPDVRRRIVEVAEERHELFKRRVAVMREETVGKQVVGGGDGADLDLEVTRQALRGMEIFKGIDEFSPINELAASMVRKSWSTGETIIRCGDIGTSMFLLAAGNVNFVSEFGITVDTASGPNTYFGEVAILQDVPRTVSVVAASGGCSTFELKKEDVIGLMQRYPTVSKAIEDVASERLQAHLMRNVLA
ncbi:hypothetical protein HDV00_000246 [Rhizophlyctis rosea]|nr:hypothetical protein HDV00_000246 [Rhizophlyctis rosea]